ncbi:hypothetical protein [Desulfovermiculus halophilus]|uniref:hypothetical protein n=1 Tax=Desulfovermiculus halophilus TaxID=339722 RepID=UPI001ABF1CD7|nr:hypothetical protein [Desulfovermiculus halophilus]
MKKRQALGNALRRTVQITALGWICVLCTALGPVLAAEPSLPAGLGGDKKEKTAPEPQLPSGLGGAAEDTSPEDGEPDVPRGLSGSAEEKSKAGTDQEQSERQSSVWGQVLDWPVHGFADLRAGPRLYSDPVQSEDGTLAEARLQLETMKYWDQANAQLDVSSDFILDGIEEEGDIDLRQLRLTWTPISSVDIRAGRQVLSWGTGDQLFINDLFPKDWQSFLIGRDVEYLKAPGDAVRVGWFTDVANFNLVYTPKFDPDRYISGERLSFFHPGLGRIAGAENEIHTHKPDDWFTDDEWALRAYRNLGRYTTALYAYFGYWKSPGGSDPGTGKSTFPQLNVYGASVQGPVGPGIGNIEIGYYDSEQDRDGDDPFVNNSEFRLLAGYEQELAHELTGSVQYYLEHMQDYSAYRNNLPSGMEARDEDRQVLTLRLTKLLMNQDLTLSFFAFYSPTDEDIYLRPRASYELSDAWTAEIGGNIFAGEKDWTFFGQFEDNSNLYASLRYSF